MPLKEAHLPEADRIFRLAFGTRNGLPDPMRFDGDASRISTRFHAPNVVSLAAFLEDRLVGTSFGTVWGSFAWLGPLSVHPDFWNNHFAQLLLERAIPALDQPGVRHQALFTVAESAKHLALYRKFGFFPWFLTALMERPARESNSPGHSLFSELPPGQQEECLQELRSISDAVFEGLDLTDEVLTVHHRSLGDTVIVMGRNAPSAFAICHYGPGTETSSGTAYVKFAAARPGADAARFFEELLGAVEQNALRRGLRKVIAGVNTGRRGAYEIMLKAGFRTVQQGVAMHRPDNPAYDCPQVYAVDDWR